MESREKIKLLDMVKDTEYYIYFKGGYSFEAADIILSRDVKLYKTRLNSNFNIVSTCNKFPLFHTVFVKGSKDFARFTV